MIPNKKQQVRLWLVVASASRYSSLSSMLAALLGPLYAAVLGYPPAFVLGIGAMSTLLLVRHRANAVRLMAGEAWGMTMTARIPAAAQ